MLHNCNCFWIATKQLELELELRVTNKQKSSVAMRTAAPVYRVL